MLEDHPEIYPRSTRDPYPAGWGALLSLSMDCLPNCMQAAGALWSLSIDGANLTNLGADGRSSSPSGGVIKTNQELIADAGGIIKLIELLRSSTKFGSSASAQVAQETIAGALHSLTARPRNRELIAQADGITHMVPLLFGRCETELEIEIESEIKIEIEIEMLLFGK